jgi:hypothetical protein
MIGGVTDMGFGAGDHHGIESRQGVENAVMMRSRCIAIRNAPRLQHHFASQCNNSNA